MIYFGCDYYPEQWSQWLEEGEERWETDAQLMADAGFNTVRLAEFAWGLLEPAADQFDFSWLDRAIEVLSSQGLQVVLSTPTPAPPPWLLAAHPSITQVTETGRHYGPGTRREACANHPVYQARSRRIVEEMAAHYADDPAVFSWQTDNEFGCHNTARCYCEHCQRAFRTWLQDRYGDLETLNQIWGTSFWGEIYRTWEQIPLPNASSAERNPGHVLDFYRFSSDSWCDYHNQQIELLRRLCPKHTVNHNLMGFFPQLNYYDLSENLDFVTWDNYHHHGATPASVAAAHSHMWGVLERNFWVMEQQVGQVNWSVYNPAPGPNFVRLKTYQGIGHGADGIIYFRWRQAVAGSEQYHSGLLDNAGRTTQGYAEASQIAAELKKLAPLLEETRPQAQVAILLDYDSRWALQCQPHNQILNTEPAPDFRLENPALAMDRADEQEMHYMTGRAFLGWPYLAPYIALWEMNVPAAIVSPESDLSQYKVVCAPFLNLLRPNVTANLTNFVAQGGALVLGPRTGFKDEANRLFSTPQPGPLAELTGATVRFFDSLEPERENELRWKQGVTLMGHGTSVGLWAEILEPNDAEVLASYTQDWYAREAAVTRHPYRPQETQSDEDPLAEDAGEGSDEQTGQTLYVGCMGGPDLYHTLFEWLLPQLDIKPLMPSMPGVEICARYGEDGRRLLFLLNHTQNSQELSLAEPLKDILSGETFETSVRLMPGEVKVFVG